MNNPARPGAEGRTLVTIAKAAELLAKAGDPITAPNVSRYVERWGEAIWSEKRGRTRMVDLAELIEHRRTNVQVADKQAARGVELAPQPAAALVPAVPAPAAPPEDAPEDGADPESLGELNRALKVLELRKRKREEDLADGSVIAADEVLRLISTALASMVTGFEQQEPVIAQRFGRDTASAFRQCRKNAQAQAARALIDLAKRCLPETMIASVEETAAVPPEEKAPETPAI